MSQEKESPILYQTPFQKVFEPFLEFLEEVAKYTGSGEFNTNSTNSTLTIIKKYKTAYMRTRDKPTHPTYFVELFNELQKPFDRYETLDDFMLWFKKEKRTYKIGPQDAPCYLPISMMFRTCTKVNENCTQMAEKDPDAAKAKGIIYPDLFMLHLFRIIQVCIPVTHGSQVRIAMYIQEIESVLGTEHGANPSFTDGFTDLMSMAEEVFDEMGGSKIPKGAFNPSMVKNAMKQFKEHGGEAKKQMKKLVSGLKINDKEDITQMFSTVMERISETAREVPEPVKKANAATAENPNPDVSAI